MNILFLTLLDFVNIEERGIYTDLLREFINNKHNLYIISPVERKRQLNTKLYKYENYQILKIKIGNVQKTNLVEKGISILTLEQNIKNGIRKYFSDIKFDVIIYSTPPITFNSIVHYVKKRDKAQTYLLLKDIFPDNAVDLRLFSKYGILYSFFRNKEKNLYKISDYIGCMSLANVRYVLEHNKYISKEKVEVCPNCISVNNDNSIINKNDLRIKFDLPQNKKIFIYGGNLGKPQGVDFIIECLKKNENIQDRHFVICGNGTEYGKLEKYYEDNNPSNVTIINGLSKKEYDELVQACDIGLIFLDYRFKIPNFPSRLLSYMEIKMPILACTDKNTDIKDIISDNNLGYWCESNSSNKFKQLVDKMISEPDELIKMSDNSFQYFIDNYTVDKAYNIIMKHFI